MRNEENLSRLLRLKRHERPADPAYFETFLADFQRRQRAEMLRTPLRTLVAERLASLFQEFQVPRLAYAGALAAFVALAAIMVVSPEAEQAATGATLAALDSPQSSPEPAAPGTVSQLATLPPVADGGSGMLLDGVTLPQGRAVYAASQNTAASPLPRYVLDARPVSYEATFSF